MIPTDEERWDALAAEKTPLRAAWDEDDDDTERHLERILPHLPGTGTILDLGCGPARLTIPIARALPRCNIVGVDVSAAMIDTNELLPENATLVVGGGSTVPLVEPGYAGGYSMLLFQHISKATVWAYIESLTRTFLPNARFTFQFTVDDGDHFSARPQQWAEWWTDMGWSVLETHEDSEVPWGWMTVRRP